MKKLILTLAIGITLLTSCSKDETNCDELWRQYYKELEAAGMNDQQINAITQKFDIKRRQAGC